MKCIIGNQVALSRPPEGPIAAQIGSFARSLGKQGYSLVSVHRQVFIAACFSRWLKQKGVGLRSICSDHPARYLRYRARHARPCRGDAAALRHLIDFLRRDGAIPGAKKVACRPTPAERCAQAFGRYLLEERALAHTTIINYVPFIRSFLEDRFGPGASPTGVKSPSPVAGIAGRKETEFLKPIDKAIYTDGERVAGP
jgi:integrase/recombinase XerD